MLRRVRCVAEGNRRLTQNPDMTKPAFWAGLTPRPEAKKIDLREMIVIKGPADFTKALTDLGLGPGALSTIMTRFGDDRPRQNIRRNFPVFDNRYGYSAAGQERRDRQTKA
jgi:hypothetical protein